MEIRNQEEYEERQPERRNTLRNLLNEAYPEADNQDPFLLNGNDHEALGYRVGDEIFDDFGEERDDEEIPIEDDN